jgi:diamine N-acetyltransferase
MNKFILRPLEEKDAELMLEWLRDEEVTKYLKIGGKNSTLEGTLRFIENAKDESANLHRAIVGGDDTYSGTVSLKNIDNEKKEAEYAITLHPSAWGKGASVTATEEILKAAFERLGLERVYLNVLEENERAVKLYEKTGFKYTGETLEDYGGAEKKLRWYEIINKK